MSAGVTDTTALSLPARLARLRGTAAAAPLGARGIEQSARTARCVRRQAITLAGLPPARVAERVGARERDQQSPFAIASGNLFERAVGMSGAHQLLALYRAAGRLRPEECRVVDIHALPSSLRRAETLRLIGQKLDKRTTAPHLILQPHLAVRIVGRDEAIRPDLLVASDDDVCYSVGDIKSFADLDGRTNAASIRGAVRQVAVGVLALRTAVVSLGATDPERLVSARAEVVLRRRGTGRPSLRVIEQVDEVDIIARHIARAPALLAAVEAALPSGATLDDPDVVMALPYATTRIAARHARWPRPAGVKRPRRATRSSWGRPAAARWPPPNRRRVPSSCSTTLTRTAARTRTSWRRASGQPSAC